MLRQSTSCAELRYRQVCMHQTRPPTRARCLLISRTSNISLFRDRAPQEEPLVRLKLDGLKHTLFGSLNDCGRLSGAEMDHAAINADLDFRR
jgi:hypothetical protein